MSDSPASQRKTVWSIVTAVMLLLSAYVGGYFALGKHMSGTVLHYNTGETSTQHHRCFQHSPLVTIYYPMGRKRGTADWGGAFETRLLRFGVGVQRGGSKLCS